MKLETRTDVEYAEVFATVIKADGQRIPLGSVAYYHRNPIRRALGRLARQVRLKLRLLRYRR